MCSRALVLEPVLPPEPVDDRGPLTRRPANQYGRSEPIFWPNHAPCAASRSCSGERRRSRPCSDSRFGAASRKCRPSVSTVRARRNARLFCHGPKRRMSTVHRSNGWSPPTIHCARASPAPPPNARPDELNPASTNSPAISGVSPRIRLPSGVKLSGPFTNCAEADLAQDRKACVALGQRLLEVLPVGLEQREGEVVGDAVDQPGLARRLERPDQDPVAVPAEVDGAVQVARDGASSRSWPVEFESR